jgi:P-type Mg2+ transporter
LRTEQSAGGPPRGSSGLTTVEATRRLAEYGPNDPAPSKRLSSIVEIARLFINPLVLILLVASAVSAWLGEDVDAGIIVTIVMLSVTVNFWQSYRSQRAADRLRASVAPTATALRDGSWQEIPLRQLVQGDVVRLSGTSCQRMHACSTRATSRCSNPC